MRRYQQKYAGSALILVVVVTVLLAVVGVMFLMASRAGETETGAIVQAKDLDAAVDTVVSRINDVLVEDLFGRRRNNTTSIFQPDPFMVSADESLIDLLNIFSDEGFDFASHKGNGSTIKSAIIHPGVNPAVDTDDIWLPGQFDDYWLASLEPVRQDVGLDTVAGTADDVYVWPHITDLWGTLQVLDNSLYYQQVPNTFHKKFFQLNDGRQWIDPDKTDIVNHPQEGWNTAALWNIWQVSAYNVRAKVIAPRDRMEVVAANIPNADTKVAGPRFPQSWETAAYVSPFGARADADGDGVADSRWVQVPDLTGNRGEPVFAAVRIIDNCAMLNLNAAHCFYQNSLTSGVSPFIEPWQSFSFNTATNKWDSVPYQHTGRYLTEINYFPLLRGKDLNGVVFYDNLDNRGDDDKSPVDTSNIENWSNLMWAKGFTNSGLVEGYTGLRDVPWTPEATHNLFSGFANFGTKYSFFDIGDELELRNRYLLTSLNEARFERSNVANFTLDSGGGAYSALRVPREDVMEDGLPHFYRWKWRVDPDNLDKWSGAFVGIEPVHGVDLDNRYKYDRRHICTFYSFDRDLRASGTRTQYPLLEVFLMDSFPNPQQRKNMRAKLIPTGSVTTNIAKLVYDEETDTWVYNYNNPETRQKILHLLFAFRDYFLPDEVFQMSQADIRGIDMSDAEDPLVQQIHKAAQMAAQMVANLIDYSDNDAANTLPLRGATEGPFYEDNYGAQANIDCTFITDWIIGRMLIEAGLPDTLNFGLDPNAIVFGYERQPFISEVYANRNPSTGALDGFAVELLNPYADDLKLARIDTAYSLNEDVWRIRAVGSAIDSPIGDLYKFAPKYDTTNNSPGRYVIKAGTAALAPGPLTNLTFDLPGLLNMNGSLNLQLLRPAPKWVRDNKGINFLVVDEVSKADIIKLFQMTNQNALKRDDRGWRFIYPEYELQQQDNGNYTHTLGQPNGVTTGADGVQLAVADDGKPLERWSDLEVLSVQAGGPDNDPNAALTYKLSDPNAFAVFELVDDPNTAAILNYLGTIDRPQPVVMPGFPQNPALLNFGALPGRININTAPLYVIAAAIPPTLVIADPNDPQTPLFFARQIVANRPYKQISDLLKIPAFRKFETHASINVGNQSIRNDIEERDWILSHLANKFTVRSDTFTAYILVRIGKEGPQRRMIAIFDRSNVWSNSDRPRLVALHPVPDPR